MRASSTAGAAPPVVGEARTALIRCTCAFIKRLCNKIGVQLLSQCTALVYFHRFTDAQPFGEHDRFVLGTACVFLAAKVEEDMRRVDAVAKAAQEIRDFGAGQVNGASESGNGSNGAEAAPPLSERELIRMIREKVLLCERVLLHSMSFDVSVTHPHIHAYNIVKKKCAQSGCSLKVVGEIRQASWNFLNDSLFTDVCVRYKPEEIAAASVVLAYHFLSKQPNLGQATQRALGPIGAELKDARTTVLDQDPRRLRLIMSEMLNVYVAPQPFATTTMPPPPPPAAPSTSPLSATTS